MKLSIIVIACVAGGIIAVSLTGRFWLSALTAAGIGATATFVVSEKSKA